MVLSIGGFSLCKSMSVISNNNAVSFSLLCSHNTLLTSRPVLFSTLCCKKTLFLSSIPQIRQAHCSLRAVFEERRSGFCGYAVKKRRKGATGMMKRDGFDDDANEEWDDGFDDDANEDWEDEGDGDGEADDDAGMFLPFGKMKKWLENKPRGFGEGKVYNTFIEDKLLEEMEQSRLAQAANLNKLKNNHVKPDNKKVDEKKEAPEVTLSRIRVRLTNLPKKKNIDRDLKSAFKGVPGIINVNPAVSGYKKTKDPVCKGFAFVDFKSEQDATKFVETFSTKSISFGRIQKQIKCELMNSLSGKSIHETSSDNASIANELMVPESEYNMDGDSSTDDSSLDSLVETASEESEDPDDELDEIKMEEISENFESVSLLELKGGNNMKPTTESTTHLNSSRRLDKIHAPEKKLSAKGKTQKVPKLDIPGAAKRLKIKEKVLLTGVLSKYAAKAASASMEES